MILVMLVILSFRARVAFRHSLQFFPQALLEYKNTCVYIYIYIYVYIVRYLYVYACKAFFIIGMMCCRTRL